MVAIACFPAGSDNPRKHVAEMVPRSDEHGVLINLNVHFVTFYPSV